MKIDAFNSFMILRLLKIVCLTNTVVFVKAFEIDEIERQ